MRKAKIDCDCGFKGYAKLDSWLIDIGHVWCPKCNIKLWLIPLEEMT